MKKPASKTSPQTLWLDTDIGDDTDDLLALALILASPELRLAGVSTVFGETGERVRLAQTLLHLHGRGEVPVAAGCGHPLPGPNSPEIWPNGPMKRMPIAQLPCARPAAKLPTPTTVHAVDALASHFKAAGGTTTLITIGAMTNLATLLAREPEITGSIPRVIAMAGEFQKTMWEWNIRCDAQAAACVVESGLPIDFIPWGIGIDCTVSTAQLDRLFASRTPTGRMFTRAIRLWRKAKPTLHHMPHLFDPMAVAVLLHPGWFEWRRGRVSVSFAPKTFGHTQFAPDANGPHRVAWSVKAPLAVRTVWQRILSL